MSERAKGYMQAVENMAYTIDQLSLRTIDPVMEKYGCTTTEEVNEHLTPEEQAEWQQVEDIASVVCRTYEVEYELFMTHVALTLDMNRQAPGGHLN